MPSVAPPDSPAPPRSGAAALLPGVALSAAIAAAAWVLQLAEVALFRHAVVEALVLAILLGMVIRTAWVPPARYDAGIRFTAKQVLETAIVLLGASVDLPLLLRAGPALAVAILLVVVSGLGGGYLIGRALGLNPRLATLIACGNAICGNSAIAAVAPVIGA
ncbi:MAG TPA: putative sulfate exporter family transporter, partial [Longimicrobium sp.]|nr:putative sulfate exporter family transporter [Longimicrobium sp.]